ncbi:MAG: SURF1 family protein [Neomegalonema sp.]|nr:SURF1 family protein [Neomegalonema sp.]
MSGGRRFWFVLIVGLGGVALLLSLGVWQSFRLVEKTALIAEREERMGAPTRPISAEAALPTLSQRGEEYRRFVVEGRFLPTPQMRLIGSRRPFGPGYSYFAAFETSFGARIIVERGFAPEKIDAAKLTPTLEMVRISGILRLPRLAPRKGLARLMTPAPDPKRGLVFARDVGELAKLLKTRPLMLILESRPKPIAAVAPTGDRFPVPAEAKVELSNNHLGYAIIWFGIAVIWATMSGLLLRRRAG